MHAQYMQYMQPYQCTHMYSVTINGFCTWTRGVFSLYQFGLLLLPLISVSRLILSQSPSFFCFYTKHSPEVSGVIGGLSHEKISPCLLFSLAVIPLPHPLSHLLLITGTSVCTPQHRCSKQIQYLLLLIFVPVANMSVKNFGFLSIKLKKRR